MPSSSTALSRSSLYAAAGPTSTTGSVRYWGMTTSPTYGSVAYGAPATSARWFASSALATSYGLHGYSRHRRGTCVSQYVSPANGSSSPTTACGRSPGYMITDALMDVVLIPADWTLPLTAEVAVTAALDASAPADGTAAEFSVGLRLASQILFDPSSATGPRARDVAAAVCVAAAVAALHLLG